MSMPSNSTYRRGMELDSLLGLDRGTSPPGLDEGKHVCIANTQLHTCPPKPSRLSNHPIAANFLPVQPGGRRSAR